MLRLVSSVLLLSSLLVRSNYNQKKNKRFYDFFHRSTWSPQPWDCWSNAVQVEDGVTEHSRSSTPGQRDHLHWASHHSSWSAHTQHSPHWEVPAAGACDRGAGAGGHHVSSVTCGHVTSLCDQSAATLVVWSRWERLGAGQSGPGQHREQESPVLRQSRDTSFIQRLIRGHEEESHRISVKQRVPGKLGNIQQAVCQWSEDPRCWQCLVERTHLPGHDSSQCHLSSQQEERHLPVHQWEQHQCARPVWEWWQWRTWSPYSSRVRFTSISQVSIQVSQAGQSQWQWYWLTQGARIPKYKHFSLLQPQVQHGGQGEGGGGGELRSRSIIIIISICQVWEEWDSGGAASSAEESASTTTATFQHRSDRVPGRGLPQEVQTQREEGQQWAHLHPGAWQQQWSQESLPCVQWSQYPGLTTGCSTLLQCGEQCPRLDSVTTCQHTWGQGEWAEEPVARKPDPWPAATRVRWVN